MAATPLFAVPMGPELVVILLIAILLFGANKIPKLARSTGQALGEFEKGKTQAEQELQQLRDTDLDAEPSSTDGGTPTEPGTDSTTDADADVATESDATEE